MLERVATGSLRIALAVVALLSIAIQLAYGLSLNGFSMFNYLSYFSILANFLAAVVLLTYATAKLTKRPEAGINDLRGAATLYLAGVLLGTLAIGGDLPPNLFGWAAVYLHYILPIAVIIDWFADPPVEPPRFKQSLRWLILPAIWVIYTLLHGPFANWYPYPLIDVATYGYLRVAIYLALATAVAVAIIVLLTRLPRLYVGRFSAKPADVK